MVPIRSLVGETSVRSHQHRGSDVIPRITGRRSSMTAMSSAYHKEPVSPNPCGPAGDPIGISRLRPGRRPVSSWRCAALFFGATFLGNRQDRFFGDRFFTGIGSVFFFWKLKFNDVVIVEREIGGEFTALFR